jgi:hypothetical protein
MSDPRCPLCGSPRLSPPTYLAIGHGNIALCYVRNPQGGVFSKGREYFGPPAGRACFDCGHVMLFLKPEDLGRLRQEAATLHPTDAP